MQGITSLEGHDKANNRMRNSLRMVVPQLSDEQKDKIMQDIMQTVSPQPEPAMPDNVNPDVINVGDQQFDVDQLQQMPMQAAEGLADMGQGGDTELAHMDPETIAMAQAMGILPEAKQNVMTGLPAFFDTAEGGMSGLGGVGGPTGTDGQGDEVNDEDEDDDTRDRAGTTGEFGGNVSATQGSPGNEAMGGLGGRAYSGDTPPQEPGIADAYGNLSQGYTQAGLTYGVKPASIVDLSKKQKEEHIDRVIDARHANNPTNAQMDLNAITERGFQTANPGISQAVGIAGTLMGLAVPGVGLATTLGNVTNTIAGQPTLMDLAVGNPKMTSTAVSGIKDSVSGFGKSITDALSGIGSLVGGTPDDSRDELSDNEEPLIETVEEDLNDAVPPVAGVNAEQEKLVAEGYDPATAELIVENFRSVDAFKQSYRSRFNAEPSASEMNDPSKQSFINIRRGQIQGMT